MRVKKPRIGRPPSGKKHRKTQVVFYLTEADARKITKISRDLGFMSRSKLITGIFESLIVGGFAPLAFLQVGFKLGKLARKKKVPLTGGYYLANRPLPALDVEDVTAEELKEVLEEVKGIEKC